MTDADKKKSSAPAKKLPAVPKSELKFVKKRISRRAILTKRNVKRSAVIALKKRENLVRAEKYSHEFAKSKGLYYVPAESRLAFVIRFRGNNKVTTAQY